MSGQKLLYEDGGTGYYGIPVAAGVQLREGAVADACEAAGMRAVCAGDSRCRWSSTRCQVVELESRLCGYTMYGLAEKICGNRDPRQCAQLDRLFAYLTGYYGGECGVVDGKYCAYGNRYIAGNPDVVYAYCVTTNNNTNITGKYFNSCFTFCIISNFTKTSHTNIIDIIY